MRSTHIKEKGRKQDWAKRRTGPWHGLDKRLSSPLGISEAGLSLQSYPVSPPGDWTWCLQTGENPWWQEGRDENRIINALHMNLCWHNPGTPGSYSGRGTGKQMFQTWELLPKNRMRWCRTTLKGHSSLGHRRPPIMRLLLEQEVKMYVFFDRKTKLKQVDPTGSHPTSQL